jgi:hypothetical protein
VEDFRLTLSVYTQPMPEAQKKLAGKGNLRQAEDCHMELNR